MFDSKERKDFTKEKAYWKKVNRPANLRERLVGGEEQGEMQTEARSCRA